MWNFDRPPGPGVSECNGVSLKSNPFFIISKKKREKSKDWTPTPFACMYVCMCTCVSVHVLQAENLYGSHPFYLVMEKTGRSHGVFLKNSNAMGKSKGRRHGRRRARVDQKASSYNWVDHCRAVNWPQSEINSVIPASAQSWSLLISGLVCMWMEWWKSKCYYCSTPSCCLSPSISTVLVGLNQGAVILQKKKEKIFAFGSLRSDFQRLPAIFLVSSNRSRLGVQQMELL